MPTEQDHPDPPTAHDHHRHDLFSTLTVISAQTQLLQRRLLRADGLSSLERDLLLGTIASTMVSLQQLSAQLEHLLSDDLAATQEEPVDADAS